MYVFLLVEDDENTLEQLRALLREVFPGCRVDVSRTVAHALELLASIRAANLTYDAALLDFRLPALSGTLEIDTSICDAIRRDSPDVPVLHFTSYSEDEAVKKHVVRAHSSTDAPRFALINKSESGWTSRLIKTLERHLYSKRITLVLDELFGLESSGLGFERRARKSGHLTHALREFAIELERAWTKPLEEKVRERILRHFEHWEHGDAEHRFTLRLPGGIGGQ